MGMTAVYALCLLHHDCPTILTPFLYISPTSDNKQDCSELNYSQIEFN